MSINLKTIKEKVEIDLLSMSGRSLYKKYLGKSGILTVALKQVPSLPLDERKIIGCALNEIKQRIEKVDDLSKTNHDFLDYSVPATPAVTGSYHPITCIMHQIKSFFAKRGFTYTRCPAVVDSIENNFTFLQMDRTHPALSPRDTFYLKDRTGYILRTHTTNFHSHVMSDIRLGDKIVCGGEVFRRDSDSTHTPIFHQIDALWLDNEINMANVITICAHLVKCVLGSGVKYRFRPAYFPFTEPSLEVDVLINDKWLEVLGAGLVRSSMLRNDLYNAKGLACGIGIERLAMIKYGISSIKQFYKGDVRFLRQFNKVTLSHD